MIFSNYFADIFVNLIAAFVIFVLGFISSKIPRSVERYQLKKFFGNALLTDDFKLVYGVLTRIISESGEPDDLKRRYKKEYHDGRVREFPLIRKIITDELVRSQSYLIQELAKFRRTPVIICTDDDAFKNLNSSFLCLGGPIPNEMTEWAINEKGNHFLEFSIPDDIEEKPIRLNVISNAGKPLSFQEKQGIDYGMILKVKNSRFPNHLFFVCAGIGTWGASGAAWFLSQNWKALYEEFGSQEFGVVVEVNIGSDTSAARVYP